MARTMLPEPMYRGDPWSIKVRFHRDISAATFLCQLRHRRGSTPLQAHIDPTHQADALDPYFTVSLTGDETAAVEDNLLNGDVQQVGGKTIVPFTVRVEGQYEELVSA